MRIFHIVLSASPGRAGAARRGIIGRLVTTLAAAVGLAVSASTALAATAKYATAAHSHLAINGTSTLHDWSAKTNMLHGAITLTGRWSTKSIRLLSVDLTIPVKSLKSSEGGGMDSTMYDALHSSAHRVITYRLTRATVEKATAKSPDSVMFDTTGVLKVNGVTRPIKLTLLLVHQAGGLTINTSTKLKMTDFDVKPPTAMFGIIRSGNAITITASWRLVKASAH